MTRGDRTRFLFEEWAQLPSAMDSKGKWSDLGELDCLVYRGTNVGTIQRLLGGGHYRSGNF